MLSCLDYLLSEYCYLMISSDPKYYYHAWKDLRWKVAINEEMHSLQKKLYLGASLSSSGEEISSMQVGVSD